MSTMHDIPPSRRHAAPRPPSRGRKLRRDEWAALIICALAIIGLIVFFLWAPTKGPTVVTPWQSTTSNPGPSFGNQSHAAPVGPVRGTGTDRNDVQPLTPVADVLFHPWPYTVHPGDTLTSIAAANGEPLAELERGNTAALAGHPNLIRPGQILIVMSR